MSVVEQTPSYFNSGPMAFWFLCRGKDLIESKNEPDKDRYIYLVLCSLQFFACLIMKNCLLLYRYGIRGPVYLRNKDGQVLYVENTSGQVDWTSGSITKSERSITVNGLVGSQTFTLLDHITVSTVGCILRKKYQMLIIMYNRGLYLYVKMWVSRLQSELF